MWWGLWCLLLSLAAGAILALIVLRIVRNAADALVERQARNTRDDKEAEPAVDVMRRTADRASAAATDGGGGGGSTWSVTRVEVPAGDPLDEVVSVRGFPDVLIRFDRDQLAATLATAGTAPVRLEHCTGPFASAVHDGALRLYAVGMGRSGCVRLHSLALDRRGAVANARHTDVANVPFNGGQGVSAAGNKLLLYTERDHGLFAFRVDGDGALHEVQDGPLKLPGGRAARRCEAGPIYVATLCAGGDVVVHAWNGVRYRHAYDLGGPFDDVRLAGSRLVALLAGQGGGGGSHRVYALRDREAVAQEVTPDVPEGATVIHADGPLSTGKQGEVYVGATEVARKPCRRACCHDAGRLACVTGAREYYVLAQ